MRSDIEKRAILEAMKSVIDAELKEVRIRTDEAINKAYRNEGTTRSDIVFDGKKVGHYSPSFTCERTEWVTSVTDVAKFSEWIAENPTFVADWLLVTDNASKLAEHSIERGGEICSGITIQSVTTPETLKGKANFKVDPEKVFDAVNPQLPSMLHGLLEA